MVEERPWPEYSPSLALTTPCEAVAMPPIKQRKTQKMAFSRSDMFCFLLVEGKGRSVDCDCEMFKESKGERESVGRTSFK